MDEINVNFDDVGLEQIDSFETYETTEIFDNEILQELQSVNLAIKMNNSLLLVMVLLLLVMWGRKIWIS